MKLYNTTKIYAPEVIHTYKKTFSCDRAAIQIWGLLYGELTFHAEKINVNVPLSNIWLCSLLSEFKYSIHTG